MVVLLPFRSSFSASFSRLRVRAMMADQSRYPFFQGMRRRTDGGSSSCSFFLVFSPLFESLISPEKLCGNYESLSPRPFPLRKGGLWLGPFATRPSPLFFLLFFLDPNFFGSGTNLIDLLLFPFPPTKRKTGSGYDPHPPSLCSPFFFVWFPEPPSQMKWTLH